MRAPWIACLVVLGGCGDDDCCKLDAAIPDADTVVRQEVATVPVTVNKDIDMLFVIDDSPSMLDKQESLKAAFPTLINVLSTLPGGFPSVHIGVVTSDLGTRGSEDSTYGPQIGSGPGACIMNGKGGQLQTNGTALVTGNFIFDIQNANMTRTKNYSGTLADAFSAIASVGAQGCGFEQTVEAAKVALNGNAANAGFLRASANLAIILLTDEDDCSAAHIGLFTTDTSTLGPLQSFRCTRFGVTCSEGGTTPAEMNTVGVKGGCQSNESSAYLTKMDSYLPFFQGLKSNPSMVMMAALAAPTSPFEVELRTPPGSTTSVTALAHSCSYTTSLGTAVGDPGVRIAHLVTQFQRNLFENVCNSDLSPQVTNIAYQIRGMVGDPCLTRNIAMPPDCVVSETNSSGTKTLPACGAQTTDCYQLVDDPTGCPAYQHLRLDVQRSAAPAADTIVSVKCVVP